jgi:hypothetical protein
VALQSCVCVCVSTRPTEFDDACAQNDAFRDRQPSSSSESEDDDDDSSGTSDREFVIQNPNRGPMRLIEDSSSSSSDSDEDEEAEDQIDVEQNE